MEIKGDFHFHLNASKRSYREKSRLAVEKSRHLNFVCSTEHAYKNPLDAFLYFRDASCKTDLAVLPGVEAISKEGIEILAIFASEHDLKSSMLLKPFSWSINDVKNAFEGCVSVIPHMFSPSTTGVVRGIGLKKAIEVVKACDYIESSNGAFIEITNTGLHRALPISARKRIEYSAVVPERITKYARNLSIGSDAHAHWGMNCYGVANCHLKPSKKNIYEIISLGTDFSLRFSPEATRFRSYPSRSYFRTVASGMTSINEAARKKMWRHLGAVN